MMQQDLTTGKITSKLWMFALPLMLGNVMQQFYNLADTWIVGRFIGTGAMAAVGAAYTLMTFLTSIILGLCLGSGAFVSMVFGERNEEKMRRGIFLSFTMIGLVTVVLAAAAFWQIDGIIRLLKVPGELHDMMHVYLYYVFWGMMGTFFYNYFSNLLRAIGNSVVPLIFLSISVGLNIVLDVFMIVTLGMGIKGAAVATTVSQYISGIGLCLYYYLAYPALRLKREDCRWRAEIVQEIASLSGYTCLQQSVMNFGILMVQGIVNSFGTAVMSAFAVAVKIDTIAYMPVQDFGNAFSTFVAQNFGAKKTERIRAGIRQAAVSVTVFCLCISAVVCLSAGKLMALFVGADQPEIIAIGQQYLWIEGSCYLGIGILFMLYGYYRAVNIPWMSLVLTVISLGTRVVLAYVLSGVSWIGVTGIWVAIPIGWALADAAGIGYYLRRQLLQLRTAGRNAIVLDRKTNPTQGKGDTNV